MKKLFVLVLVVFVVLMSGCSAPTNEVLESLGEYKSEQYFTSGGFQDYTDYAKYTYEDVDFSNNIYFSEISTESSENLITHIKDFEKWVELLEEDNEVALAYDFDSSVISNNDYLYIYDDTDYPELGNYDVYYFDNDTMTQHRLTACGQHHFVHCTNFIPLADTKRCDASHQRCVPRCGT